MAVITISRGTFSGGKYLAGILAGRLGYRSFSREELLVLAARRYAIPKYALTAALDSKPGFPEGMNIKRIQYIAYVRATLAKEVENDDVVYHGQVGHFLLSGIPNLLKVRVVAGKEYRIRAAMDQYQVKRDAAISIIRKIDQDRSRWAEVMYQVDWEDLSQYDLVVDIDTMSITEACDRIIKTVRTDLKPTAESRRKMNDFVLATDIRARIAKHEAIHDDAIMIETNDGIVTIKGKADSAGEAHRIVETARQTPGVKGVTSKLRVLEPAGVYAPG